MNYSYEIYQVNAHRKQTTLLMFLRIFMKCITCQEIILKHFDKGVALYESMMKYPVIYQIREEKLRMIFMFNSNS